MKKVVHFFLFFTILLFGGLCAIGLASCENFFNGGELAKEIKDSVGYANAESCKVYLKSDAAMGSFLAKGEAECKVGYSTDIQFSLNQNNYFFVSLEAVSTADETLSRDNYVQFKLNEEKSDTSKGVYVTSVKLIKPANDILIRPKCIEMPYVKSYTPSGTKTQPANTPIVIVFNTPVGETEKSNGLFNYTNIKLIDADTKSSVSAYFYPPEFNSQNTVLTLTPDGEKFANYLKDEQKSYIDVNVSFSEEFEITIDDFKFPIRQDSNSNFTVKYNSEMETTAPQELSLFVTREEITLDSADSLADDKKIRMKAYSSIDSNNDYKQMLIPSTIYIYGKYYDVDSGVAAIEVTETLDINNQVTGEHKGNDNNFISYVLRENNDCVKFVDDGSGYTTFVIKHTMQESLRAEPRAGIFDLQIKVKDNCGNYTAVQKCAVNYLVYSDISYYTSWDKVVGNYPATTGAPANVKTTPFDVCNAPFSKAENDDTCYDFSKYNSDIKTIRIKDEYKPSVFLLRTNISHGKYWTLDEEYYISCNDVDYYCEYIDKNGNKRRDAFSPYNSETMERSVVLDVDSVSDLSFYVIPVWKETGIQIGRKKFTYPSAVVLSKIDDYLNISYPSSGDTKTCNPLGICKYSDNKYKLVFNIDYYIKNSNIPTNAYFYLCNVYLDGERNLNFPQKKYEYHPGLGNEYKEISYTSNDLDNNFTSFGSSSTRKRWFEKGLMGELIGPYEKNQSSVGAPAKPTTTIEKTKGKEGFVNLTLKWDSDLWDKYDYLDCSIKSTQFKLTQSNTYTKDGQVCYTVPVETKLFFNVSNYAVSDYSFWYYCKGTKNNIISPEESQKISLTTEEKTAFDDLNPSELYYFNITSDRNNQTGSYYVYAYFCFYDYGSGPDYGEFYINGGSTKYEITDPVQSKYGCYGKKVGIKVLNIGNNTIDYVLKDKKGNTTKGTLTFSLKNKLSTDVECLDDFSISGKTFTATVNDSRRYRYYVNANSTMNIFGLSPSYSFQFEKTLLKEINKDNQLPTDTYSFSVDATGYDYIKVVYTGLDFYSPTAYVEKIYYIGSSTKDAKNNCVIADGNSKESIIIQSNDANVFVRIYRADKSKEECKLWTAGQWELLGTLDQEDSYTVTPNVLTEYRPSRSVYPSTYYYCYVVHFANGTYKASPVLYNF